MSNEKLILINLLCKQYEVESSLFSDLHELGIIKIQIIEDLYFIHEEEISIVEKVIRIHRDLNINLEGIDAVLNLLEKISDLQKELNTVRNRLLLYEG